MNYVSLQILRYAAMLDSIERYKAEHPEARVGLTCNWQPNSESLPCGKPAEYLVPDGTRVATGGDIEAAPQWFCKEHLEHELKAPVREQPIFERIQSFGKE